MLVSGSRKAARAFFGLTRELILIIAVGALGGQLLIALNGGEPIGTAALAASSLPAQPVPRVASLEFDLEPYNPAMVRSVFVQLGAAHRAAIEHLYLSPTPASPEKYECHEETQETWHCPTPGLRVVELEQIVLEP
jgi:hypothetical protein